MNTRTFTGAKDITVGDVTYYVEFDWTASAWRENYGADADGNRGRMMDMREAEMGHILKVERYDDSGMTELEPGTAALDVSTVNAILADIETYIDSDDAYDFAGEDEPEID